MSNNLVLIVVDNPKRDLPACLILADQIKKSGISVMISPMSEAPYDTFRYYPKHVILNYLRVSNLFFVKALIKSGISWSVLDTEGGVFLELPDGSNTYTKGIIDDIAVRNCISHYFCWGGRIYSYLKDNQIYPENSLRLTGTPRTDALLLAAKKNESKSLFLINTSFPLINPKFSTREKEFSLLVNLFNYDPAFLKKRSDALDIVMVDFIDLAKELSTQFPNTEVVFRPHPFESLEPYLDAFSGISNINVTNDHTVDYWLTKAYCIIHYECSTALEAALIHCPAFSLRKHKDYDPIPDVQSLTEFCETPGSLLQRLKELISNANVCNLPNEVSSIIRDIYYQPDGNAAARIASCIEESMINYQNRKLFEYIALMYYTVFYFVKKWGRKISLKQQSKEKNFSFHQVSDVLKRYECFRLLKVYSPESQKGISFVFF